MANELWWWKVTAPSGPLAIGLRGSREEAEEECEDALGFVIQFLPKPLWVDLEGTVWKFGDPSW
jgi:hypothetical protein